MMVKSTQDVASDDAAAALNGLAMRGIFVQAEMGPSGVLIRSRIRFSEGTDKSGLL
jgi:hypothetical protein